MTTGKPLNNVVTEIIFQAAQKMAREKLSEIKLDQPGITGYVQTKYDHVSFASVSGIRFKASIDVANGSTKTTFVIPEDELGIEDEGESSFWATSGPSQAKTAWIN